MILHTRLRRAACLSVLTVCISIQQYMTAQSSSPTVPEPTAVITNAGSTQQQSTQQEDTDAVQQEMDILAYGLDSEITELISKYIAEKDFHFADEVQQVFETTKTNTVKQKCIEYFAAAEDPRLKEYALAVAQDPYDESKELVASVFQYIGKLAFTEAAPYARKIIDDENEDYFDAALSALGSIGSAEDALFLADFLDRPDMPTARRQALMRVLGQLHAVETSGKLLSIAQDENENTFVRMYAVEALGEMQDADALAAYADLYNASDPNLRASVIKALSHYDGNAEAQSIIEQALRDNHYKVRLEAVAAIKQQNLVSAGDALVYRAKNDPESVVKYACYDAIAYLNFSSGNDFLISIVKDSRKGDTAQSKAAAALLQYGNAGTQEIIALANDTLADDKKKNLRYALGKEFAKYSNPAFSAVCQEYLKSTDVSTQGIGLDIYARNRFPELTALVEEIAGNDKAGPNKVKANRILHIPS